MMNGKFGFRIRRKKPAPQVGAPPGTLVIDPDAPPPVIRVTSFGPDEVVSQIIDEPERITEYLGLSPVLWVDVIGLGDADMIARIGKVFGLHRLALADVVNVRQRPKVEEYEDHLFIVTRAVSLDGRLETEQISLFLGRGYVVSFQQNTRPTLDPVARRIKEGRGIVRRMGSDYLAYTIMDSIIDGYFPVVEEISDRLDYLEKETLAHANATAIRNAYEIKRNLVSLRRAIWPAREAFAALMRDTGQFFTDETRIYLRDCYDHTIQIMDLVESHRETVADLTNLYLSSVSNRMNEIMKILTIIGSIFIPLTFIAGVYGMNFDPETSPLNMPELRWKWGYPATMAVMALVAGLMIIFFWHKGWLGSFTSLPPDEGESDDDKDDGRNGKDDR